MSDKLEFYEQLTALLKGDVQPKSEETINGEAFCDALKARITRLLESAHKLDVFSDEFNLQSFLAEHINFPLKRMKEQIEKTWLQDKLTIGLMGHFATGKTTALNLLFGESFQTNRRENTALPTYLTYGRNNSVVRIVDRAGQTQELTLDECKVLDYSVGVRDFPFARIFNYMVKENNNKSLKDLTIIDTPGLFSTTTGHSVPTLNVVSSCDAVFWFVKVTDSLSKDEINTIKESLNELPVYLVCTFVDAMGTTPKGVETSITNMMKALEKAGVNCKGVLKLGKKESYQEQFKKDAFEVLQKLSKDNEVYNPWAHIIAFLNWFEEFLVKLKSDYTETIGKLDKETDDLLDAYRESSRSFVSEHSNCMRRFNSMIETFNNRCAPAMFCGGASEALVSQINRISESFNRMTDAYNNMDVSKMIEFGKGVAQMQLYQYKLSMISETLTELTTLKEALK